MNQGGGRPARKRLATAFRGGEGEAAMWRATGPWKARPRRRGGREGSSVTKSGRPDPGCPLLAGAVPKTDVVLLMVPTTTLAANSPVETPPSRAAHLNLMTLDL
ncbi:hypothetical protein NL676_011516 [Syzygium grande]|nr:hypothetical protein NL676_011516 [Syzygium grande]